MKNSKLIQYLQKLKKKELKNVDLFLRSPYFNNKNEVINLFEFLKSFHPYFDDPQLTKQNIFSQLFSERKYNDKEMRYLMTYLSQLLEEYFVVSSIQRRTFRKEVLLLEEFIYRFPLEKAFNQKFKAAKTSFEKQEKHFEEASELNHKLFDLADKHFLMHRERKNDPNIQLSSNHLDEYYVLKKLKYSCGMLSRERILSGSYNLHFVDDIRKWVKNDRFKEAPLIQIYAQILEMLMSDFEVEDFKVFKELLQKNEAIIDKSELPSIYQYGTNFCLAKLRGGDNYFNNEALNLYISGIEKNFFLPGGELSPWIYTNVVKLGIRAGKFDLINDFIYSYSNQLPLGFRDDVFKYNLAELHFVRGEFDGAIALLQEVNFTDLNFQYGSRIILSKTYYECNEFQALFPLLASFSIFLKRNKQISKEIKQTCLNFCQFLKKITKANKKEKLEQIKTEMEAAKLLTERKWLLEKIQIKQQTLRN